MAEKRAAFIFRRRRSLGFSKCRWLRTSFKVPSRSIFFFNRRNALSTGSPFFSLISVKKFSLPLYVPRVPHGHAIIGRLTCFPAAHLSTLNFRSLSAPNSAGRISLSCNYRYRLVSLIARPKSDLGSGRTERSAQFKRHYEQIAQPFQWRFTRRNLNDWLENLAQQDRQQSALAA